MADFESPEVQDEWKILEGHVDRRGLESSSSPTRMLFERSQAIHDYAVQAAGRKVTRAVVEAVVNHAVDRLVATLIDRIDFPGPQFSDHIIAAIVKPFAKHIAAKLIMYAYDRAIA